MILLPMTEGYETCNIKCQWENGYYCMYCEGNINDHNLLSILMRLLFCDHINAILQPILFEENWKQ